MSNYVTVEHLTKRFGDLVAVDDLSFTVKEGEIFGFLGPNGAGKSTTLNIITTLIDSDKGKIMIGGYNLEHHEKKVKSLIGVVPQNIALFPTLTAYENVSFFASLYGMSGGDLKESVNKALGFVGMLEHSKTKAVKMSGGMQRRLNIACGICHKPKLIIMDEPTVGVDAQSRELIMDSIRTLQTNGATVIYTSHYMPEVQDICDRIAIIDNGRLAAIGTKEELLEVVTDFKTIFIETDKVDESHNGLVDSLKSIHDVRHVMLDTERSQIRIDVPLSFGNVTPILKVIMDKGMVVNKLNSEAPNLETTFLALTGRELN